MGLKAKNFAEAYKTIVEDLMYAPQFICEPRGIKIKEHLNYKIEIEDPFSNLFTNKVRSVPVDYLAKELILYFSGTNKIEYYGRASSFWKKIANEDDTVNSAYGHLMFAYRDTQIGKNEENKTVYGTQFAWCLKQLLTDKDTRQAIIHINRPIHQVAATKDFPCTLDLQFFIRENKLYLTTHMRSNDVIKGVTFDFPFFMIFQQNMLLVLQQLKYPDLEMGTYTHMSASMHAYESDWNLLKEMIKYRFKPCGTPPISENLIGNSNIMLYLIDRGDAVTYNGDDEFIKWLDQSRKS